MRRQSLKNFQNSHFLFFFEQSHSAENSEKRDPLGFLTFVLLQNIKKLKGELFGDI